MPIPRNKKKRPFKKPKKKTMRGLDWLLKTGTCVACEGTGVSSKRGKCRPCKGTGRKQ